SVFFFFFQAEDGIRDPLVTGVQTCALPISPFNGTGCVWSAPPSQGHWTKDVALTAWTPLGSGWNLTKPYPDPHSVATELLVHLRSEERRVGKECRSRWL